MSNAVPVRKGPVVPRLGILGGGQLARMTAQAASTLGCEVYIVEREAACPAQGVDTHALVGDWNDPETCRALARMVDVVTLESEFVNLEALRAVEASGVPLWPSAATLSCVQDKCVQKETFARAGIRTTRFGAVDSIADARAFGCPLVLKKRLNSYDGKGNATVQREVDLVAAWDALGGGLHPLYAEAFCDFTMELAIIVTRGRDGSCVCYPVVETVNRDHICHVVRAPASVPHAVAREVESLAMRAVTSLDGVGSFGLEFFLLSDGTVVLNEIAPRVHNTGHYSIEACECSQFENHVRAVLGWPLGSAAMRAGGAVMINLLGAGAGSGDPVGLEAALAVPGAHVHVYGKADSKPGRKMGHVTALGVDVASAEDTARRAAACIRFGGAS